MVTYTLFWGFWIIFTVSWAPNPEPSGLQGFTSGLAGYGPATADYGFRV